MGGNLIVVLVDLSAAPLKILDSGASDGMSDIVTALICVMRDFG